MENPSDNVMGRTDEIPASMRVASSVLEPITISQTTCKFVLESKGILSRDTCLQFQLLGSSQFLPIGSGIYSLIKTATLRAGATRICEMPQLAFYRSMTHAYDTPSYRLNYTRLQKGINTTVANTPVSPGIVGDTNPFAGRFQPAGASVGSDPVVTNLSPDIEITNSAATSPVFTIYLRELFPILDSIELPLFLMKDEVAIDLTFNVQTTAADGAGPNTNGSLACSPAVAGADVQNTCRLNTESVLMYVDTIYYANERMELVDEAVNDSRGMSLLYTDVMTNVANVGQLDSTKVGADDTTFSKGSFTHIIPVSGFAVKNILWCYNTANRTSASSSPASGAGVITQTPTFYNGFFGKYAMSATVKPDTWNIRVNDQLLFPEFISNPSYKAQEAGYVYGSPVNLNQALYSFNATAQKSGAFLANANTELFGNYVANQYELWGGLNGIQDLTGQQHFVGVNLSTMYGDSNDDTTLVNQKPIEVIHQSFPVNSTTNFNYNAFYYVEHTKRFSLLGGAVRLQNGPGLPKAI